MIDRSTRPTFQAEKAGAAAKGSVEKRRFSAGAVLYREGELPDYAYYIQSGKIDIFLVREGREILLATLGVGELFGEMALIDRAPRSAAARAREESEVVIITDEKINRLLSETDPALKTFLNVMTKRLRRVNERLGELEKESANAPTVHQM
jgi:CRP-like cAMP-binding protein